MGCTGYVWRVGTVRGGVQPVTSSQWLTVAGMVDRSIATTGLVRMRCWLCRVMFWRVRTHPCLCCSARRLPCRLGLRRRRRRRQPFLLDLRRLPCRLDLRRRRRRRQPFLLDLRRRRRVQVRLRRRLVLCRRHVGRSRRGGRRRCDGLARRSILFIGGRMGRFVSLFQPSTSIFLLFLRFLSRGRHGCRRLATLPLALRWIRLMVYRVCHRRSRVAAHAGKVA